MERTSLAFAVSFLGNWRESGRGKGFWGLREGPSLSLSPFLSPSLSPDCKFIVAWPRVFCSLIPQRERERARPPARQRRYLLYFPRRGVRRRAGNADGRGRDGNTLENILGRWRSRRMGESLPT